MGALDTKNERLRTLLISWPEKALKYLYDSHHRSLLHLSEWKTHDRGASEEIIQDSLTEIWLKRDWFAEHTEVLIEPYLFTIVRNKSVTFFNRASRMNNRLPINGIDTAVPSPEFDLIVADDDALIWTIISTFPEREKECLTLKFQQNMTNEQIAAVLAVSKKAVERSITSAYRRLRSHRHHR